MASYGNRRSPLFPLQFSILAILSSLWLACGEGGPTQPQEPPQVAGVWEGSFQSTQSQLQGIFCVTLEQSGNSLSGQLYVAGRGLVGSVSGQVRGDTISYGVVGGLQFSGRLSGSQASGTYGGLGDQGNWTASRTAKTACEWAASEQVSAFQNLISGFLSATGESEAGPIAQFIASTITRLPTTSISAGSQQRDGWWICIWEIDGVPTGEGQTSRYTLGVAYGANPLNTQQQAAVIWITPQIHQQTTTFPGQENEARGAIFVPNLANLSASWFATAGEYSITGDSDTGYQNPAYLVQPNVAPVGGMKVEARTTTLTGHLQFTATDMGTGASTPVRLPASGDWQNLEAVHLLVRSN
ncbi:hypothetical protein HRbin33_01039 [bacterium HR33]|nr:hypothetical protein HRbin33_01039 [bacterium HR33]